MKVIGKGEVYYPSRSFIRVTELWITGGEIDIEGEMGIRSERMELGFWRSKLSWGSDFKMR